MSSSPPPVDRAAASRAAVAARRARAAVKQDIATGRRSTIEVLDISADPGHAAEHSLRITDFLLSIPHIGVTRSQRILEQLRIASSKRLGGLGVKQRERLRAFLLERGERPRLTVLAGPTAVGKGTISAYLRDHYPDVLLSVSATTRAPRPGEVPGRHYHFVTPERFGQMVDDDELLEHAMVHGKHRYGTPRTEVERALAEGRHVLLEIDLQGARQVKQRMPEARMVFLLPPSWDELVRRLIGRGTESHEEQERRLRTAEIELAAQGEFEHRIVNDEVPRAARQLAELMGVTKEHL